MVNKIIETTSTDDMNIITNLMQFAGALLITNKVTLPNQQPIENQEWTTSIIIHHHVNTPLDNTSKKTKQKFKTIWKT